MRHARLLSLVAFAVAGCNGSGLNPNNDMAVADLGGPDLTGASMPDLATPPTNNGTKLASGAVDFLAGVTTDDYVVYYQGATAAAVSLAGGSPKTIDTDSAGAQVSGKLVLSFSNADATTGQTKLTVWSAAGQTPKLITANAGTVAAASADGTMIAYIDNVSPDGSLGDVFIANADGTNAQPLLTSVTTSGQTGGCAPELAFTPTRLLVAHCPDPGDAGTSAATLSSYLIAGGGAVDVATDLQTNASGHFFSVDTSGANMVVFDVNSNILLAAPDGTGAHPILDPGAVLDGYVLKDGSAAIYITANNELKRVPLAGGMTPVSLGPTTVTAFAPDPIGSFRSFDDKWVVWFTMGGSVNGINDLFVSSTQTPGNAITLTDMPTGFIFGDAFTADSSRVLFGTDVDMNFAGTLKSQALPTGTPTTHSTVVWEVHAGAGTKIVMSDNFTQTMVGMQTIQRGDIRVVDSAAASGTPKLIVTQADVGELMSTARDKVVYSWKQKAGSEGLYVAPATP